jgi:hypothetical protein
MPTYSEKLRDPRWQIKRLEAMQRADFECENCGDRESTLHVHHNCYFKGRDPWEYDNSQLTVLCESCHQAHHESPTELDEVCSRLPFGGTEFASLLVGFTEIVIPDGRDLCPYTIYLGMLAKRINDMPGLGIQWLIDILDMIESDPHRVRDVLQAITVKSDA